MGCELEDLESVDTQVWLNQIHPEECNKIWEDFGSIWKKEKISSWNTELWKQIKIIFG
jgi:hypothetical protein